MNATTFELPSSGLLAMKTRARGVEVVCLEGELWVTQEGDPVDHILGPGQRWHVSSSGRLVIAALRPSRGTLCDCH